MIYVIYVGVLLCSEEVGVNAIVVVTKEAKERAEVAVAVVRFSPLRPDNTRPVFSVRTTFFIPFLPGQQPTCRQVTEQAKVSLWSPIRFQMNRTKI